MKIGKRVYHDGDIRVNEVTDQFFTKKGNASDTKSIQRIYDKKLERATVVNILSRV